MVSGGREGVSVSICPSRVPAGVAGLHAITVDAAGAPGGVLYEKMVFLAHFSTAGLLNVYVRA